MNNNEAKARCADIIIDEIAESFGTDGQSVKSRLVELGFVAFWDMQADLFCRISLKDAFQIYCDNDDFRKIVASQYFRFVEGVLIDSVFIIYGKDGIPTLNEYGKINVDKYALRFSLAKNFLMHGKDRKLLFYQNEYGKRKPTYEAANNVSAIQRAKADFEIKYSQYNKTAKTFTDRVCEFMEARGWKSYHFMEKTGLDERAYFRITSCQTKKPKIKTVLRIIIGLQLSSVERAELLLLAGYPPEKSKQYFAYIFILDSHEIRTAEDFNNAYLELETDNTEALL
jgi:hypothetical protein